MLSTEDWLFYLSLADNDDYKKRIIKFIFLWMKYNGWYAKFRLGDSEGAMKLSDNEKAQDIYEKIKHEFLNGGRNITTGFVNIPLDSSDNISRKGLYRDNGKLLCTYNANVNCLYNYLKTVYKIRCNFFHGDKLPSNTNILLIIWAYETLYMFLKELIKNRIIDLKL